MTDKNNNKNKTSTKSKQTIHIVKKGDTLYDIAKKYYGKGSSYKKIIEKNTPYNGKAEIIQIKTLAGIRGIFIYFPFFLIPVIWCIAL